MMESSTNIIDSPDVANSLFHGTSRPGGAVYIGARRMSQVFSCK